MIEKHTFFMPDTYQEFACKMGACRHACCVGWPISFSLEDYFHLTSLECSPELRERMDRGIRILLQPTPDRYAQIAPRYDGECSMRLADGRCALHAELGEEALTNVCRLYPRGIHFEDGYEISCANSCEAVLENLFAREEPIRFIHEALEMHIPEAVAKPARKTMGRGQEIRLSLIAQMQDRSLTLPQRLMALGSRMRALEAALQANDEVRLNEVLAMKVEAPAVCTPVPEHFASGIEKVERLLELLAERSDSVRDYAQEAMRFFKEEEGDFARYTAAKERFETLRPRWEIEFEHMLVNHMFFSDFPFEESTSGFYDEYVALCVLYGFLRFLSIGCIETHADDAAYTDVCAAAFRLVEHTTFDHYVVRLWRSIGGDDLAQIREWIAL